MIIYLRQTFILFVCVTCRYGVKTFDTKVKRELLCEAAMCTFCECSYVSERAKRTPEGKGGGGILPRLMGPISSAIQQGDHTLPILLSFSILFPISLSPSSISLDLTLIK